MERTVATSDLAERSAVVRVPEHPAKTVTKGKIRMTFDANQGAGAAFELMRRRMGILQFAARADPHQNKCERQTTQTRSRGEPHSRAVINHEVFARQ